MPRSARVAPGGMLFHVLNRAVGRQRLFFDEFWADSAASFGRSSQRILRLMLNPGKTSLARDIFGRIAGARGARRPRIVIQSPIPYLVPIPAMFIIGIPGKIRLGPVQIGIAVQLEADQPRIMAKLWGSRSNTKQQSRL